MSGTKLLLTICGRIVLTFCSDSAFAGLGSRPLPVETEQELHRRMQRNRARDMLPCMTKLIASVLCNEDEWVWQSILRFFVHEGFRRDKYLLRSIDNGTRQKSSGV